MRSLVRPGSTACVAVALIAGLFTARHGLPAQSITNTRFDALVALTEAKMKEYGVPGVALGIIADGVITTRGLGITNVEDSLPVTAHTVFPIASISKTFAATAMMRLVEQGKVDLRAPVRTYIPSFKVRDDAVSRDVTVWHLLTHLGGWEGQVSGPDRGTATLENFVARRSRISCRSRRPARRGATTTPASASPAASSRSRPGRPSIAPCATWCSSR